MSQSDSLSGACARSSSQARGRDEAERIWEEKPQEWVWDQRLGVVTSPKRRGCRITVGMEVIKQRKAVESRGGFKQDWPEHIIFILAVVWFGLNPTGHLQTPAADS